MTTILDGPAKGQHLMLRRCARFLRVTEASGKFDALDQPSDVPTPDEKLYAYEVFGTPGSCHINRRGGGGGFYEYKFVEPQPSDAEMRTGEAWHKWVMSKVAK